MSAMLRSYLFEVGFLNRYTVVHVFPCFMFEPIYVIRVYTLIRKSYDNVHPPATMSFLHFLARTEGNYNI